MQKSVVDKKITTRQIYKQLKCLICRIDNDQISFANDRIILKKLHRLSLADEIVAVGTKKMLFFVTRNNILHFILSKKLIFVKFLILASSSFLRPVALTSNARYSVQAPLA